MTRCCLYARVSKENGDQNPENQIVPLRAFAASQGWQIVHEYVDRMSGAKSDRPQFKAMMNAASRREFDICLFWALDRFSRLSMVETLVQLKQLSDYGVRFRSLQEPYIDTTNPFGDVIVAFIAKLSEMERLRIRARVKAGLETARAKGSRLGRPPVVIDRQRVRELHEQGKSLRAIAIELKAKKSTVERALKSA